jgi:signal transduction histidine kinase
VRDSSTHLLNLINDVLDISKIEAGQMQIVKVPFDLRASIGKTINVIRPQAEKKMLVIEVEFGPGSMNITSDQRRVEQIILNLLSNAIKFTEKGKIRIECSMSEGQPAVPEKLSPDRSYSIRMGQVMVNVIDTGIGIKNMDMNKLFRPFRQIDIALTRKYEGTGLGLSICKKLVELLGGIIWVESEWGKGSTFSFTIPVT